MIRQRSKRAAAAIAESRIREAIEEINLPEDASFKKKQRKIDDTENFAKNGNRRTITNRRRSYGRTVASRSNNVDDGGDTKQRSDYFALPRPMPVADLSTGVAQLSSDGLDSPDASSTNLSETLSISSGIFSFARSLPFSGDAFYNSSDISTSTILSSSSSSPSATAMSSTAKARRDHQRRRAERQINTDGPMFLSQNTTYKMKSGHASSPQYSPIRAFEIHFTPVAGRPTTPLSSILRSCKTKART